VEDIITAMK